MFNGIWEFFDVFRWCCFYYYVDYLILECEVCIFRNWVDGIDMVLVFQIVELMGKFWKEDLIKVLGVVEIIDWVVVFVGFGIKNIYEQCELVYDSFVCVLKIWEDQVCIMFEVIDWLLGKVV